MPNKYDKETQAKAVRLVRDHVDDYDTEWAAIQAISARLGMSTETFTFAAIERIASHCESYSAWHSSTNVTARSRTSREYFVLRAMIHILTHTRSLHRTRGASGRALEAQ